MGVLAPFAPAAKTTAGVAHLSVAFAPPSLTQGNPFKSMRQRDGASKRTSASHASAQLPASSARKAQAIATLTAASGDTFQSNGNAAPRVLL